MSEVPGMMTAVLGFAPGAVGGFCNAFVGHPMDLIKVRQQTSTASATTTSTASSLRNSASTMLRLSQESTFGMLRRIMVTDGIRGLYQGVSAPLVAVVPAFAITFWSYDLAARVQLSRQEHYRTSSSPQGQLSIAQIGLAGGFSGIPLALVVGPLERFKCLMQVNPTRYRNLMDCVQQVYQQGGWRSMFRGTGLTVLRDVPGNAAYFASYEFWKRTLHSHQGQQQSKPSMATTLLAGGMAGVGNWIVAIPMDVLKSRWQTAAPGTYHNIGHVLRVLIETEGPAALFCGLGPALMRAFPANAACLLGVETARSLLAVP